MKQILPSRGGRPTKQTPAVVRLLVGAIAAGMTDAEAAALAGISRDTLSEWRKADGGFAAAIRKATVWRMVQRLEYVESGRPGWQAVAWILERTYRGRFARPARSAGAPPGCARVRVEVV